MRRSGPETGNGQAANANGVRDTSGGRRHAQFEAPMLVKPSSSAELPEQAIQRDGERCPSASFN